MSNETLFYVCGIALAVSAVGVSLIGLRVRDFPGRFMPLVALWFVILVGCGTTFAVLHAQDEEKAKGAELSKAGEEIEEEEETPVKGGSASEEKTSGKAASGSQSSENGAGETLKLSAEATKIAFNTTTLTAKKAGNVTIDFSNPSALEHDVAIEQNGKQIAISETIAEGDTSVSANLKPGTYTYLCTVPGHAEAGMQGTLTVR